MAGVGLQGEGEENGRRCGCERGWKKGDGDELLMNGAGGEREGL